MGFAAVLTAWMTNPRFVPKVVAARKKCRELEVDLARAVGEGPHRDVGRVDVTRVFKNLDTDLHLGDEVHTGRDTAAELRSKLLEHLSKTAGTTTPAGAFIDFCYAKGHQQKGPACTVGTGTVFGHVRKRSDLENHLKNESRAGFSARAATSPSLTVSSLLHDGLDDQRARLKGLQLSQHQMWSFYQSSQPADPFDHVDCSEEKLCRRLGLGHVQRGEELLIWGHRLPFEAHVPTAIDADLSPYWQPGGRTCPLYGADDGLDEVVHAPVEGQDLVLPISRV